MSPALLFAAPDLGFSFGPPAEQPYRVQYSGELQNKSSFYGDGQEGYTTIHKEFVGLSAPVYRATQDGLILSSSYQLLDFSGGNPPVSDLHNIQMGAAYTHAFADSETITLKTTFGSASDKPFKDSSVDTVGATALYSVPSGEHSRWILLLNYSNNRAYLNNLPIPGFAYVYAPSKNFRGVFGLPFASIYWQFTEKWIFNAFLLAPATAEASFVYTFAKPVQAYAGFDFSQSTYLKYGRENSKDRLFFAEKKVFLGIKSPFGKTFGAELEGGYAFDRTLFSAERYTPSPSDEVSINPSPYVKLGMTLTL